MENRKDVRKELVNTIAESMKGRDSVWQKTWVNMSNAEAPYNPITGNKYSGVNFLALSLKQTELNTHDPRWCTFKQAAAAGYKVNKESKAAHASFYDFEVSLGKNDKKVFIKAKSTNEYVSKIIGHYKAEYPDKAAAIEASATKAKASRSENQPDKVQLESFVTELNKATGADIKLSAVMSMKSFPIFNYSQLQNVPELEIKQSNKLESIQRADGILVASGAKIHHDLVDDNFYSHVKHEIHLTAKESFKSPDAYYSTVLQEMAHWTKGEENDTSHIPYARDELRTELANIFMSSDLDFKLDIQNRLSHAGAYIELLNDDHTELFAAVTDAHKIATHVLGFEKRLDLESTESKELQSKNPELYKKIVEYKAQESTRESTIDVPWIETEPTHDFKVGDVYTTTLRNKPIKYEILEVGNDTLVVLDTIHGERSEYGHEEFQEVLDIDKTVDKNQSSNLDSKELSQKAHPNKVYLETFFDEKNLPFKQFTITHDGRDHIVPNEAVIEYITNAIDPATQGKIRNTLVQLDFANADINHYLEHCAKGMVLQLSADMAKSAEYKPEVTKSAPEKVRADAIEDDNDFTI